MYTKHVESPEFILSLTEGDIATATVHGIDVPDLGGVKVLMNERYQRSGVSHEDTYNYAAACALMASRKAKKVILDSKISADNLLEMREAIKVALNPNPGHAAEIYPTHMTADYYLPEEVLERFAKILQSKNITPMLVLPTSRNNENDFKRLGTNVETLVGRASIFANEIGATLIVGAVDAEIARSASSEVELVGVGARIEHESQDLIHARSVLVSDCAEYLDGMIFGHPIFQTKDPVAAIDDRKLAMQAN